jgi:hypothetical protein
MERPGPANVRERWLLPRVALAGAVLLLAGVLGWAALGTGAVALEARDAAPPRQDPAPEVRTERRATPAAAAKAVHAEAQMTPAKQDDPAAPKTGIDAFPKPGTKPVRVGLVVPDGFALPPGYVRHYQTLDDGTQLRPVLMFHPDFKPVDAQGNAVEVPWDRIVPPELAPKGMPIEMLELPAQAADEK